MYVIIFLASNLFNKDTADMFMGFVLIDSSAL